MKNVIEHFKENWIKYGLETVVVTIGIIAAFSLNSWNENRLSRDQELLLLNEINNEFRNNKAQLKLVTSYHELSYRASVGIIDEFPINTEITNLDSLSKKLWELTNTYSFNASQGTVNSIISSSLLHLISNPELRSKLVAWQDLYLDYVEGENIANQDVMNHLFPYLNKHFQFEMNLQDDRFDKSILTSLEFENMIKLRRQNLENIISNQENELEILNTVIDEIIRLTKEPDKKHY